MIYSVTNIVYDLDGTDGEVQELNSYLPHKMNVEAEDESLIADAISDQTGYLVKSFSLEML
jgi:hypothetical protein